MSDDDLDFDYTDDDEVSQAQQNRQNAAQRKAEKEQKALNAELEELRAFKAERVEQDRRSAVAQTFQAFGLNPQHARFYDGEETTEDAIKAWAVENQFIAASEDDAPAEPAPTGFTPTVIAGSEPLGNKVYSFDEWMALSQTDQAKADALWKAGRVADAVRE